MKPATRLLLAASLGLAAVVVVARHPDKQELLRTLKAAGERLAAWGEPVLNELSIVRQNAPNRVADGWQVAQEQALTLQEQMQEKSRAARERLDSAREQLKDLGDSLVEQAKQATHVDRPAT